MGARNLGLYESSSDLEKFDKYLSCEASMIAIDVSLSVVGVSCSTSGNSCSGLVVEWAGGVKILTSAYIFGDSDACACQVKVLLPNRSTVDASVMFVDEMHNFAILSLELNLDSVLVATIGAKCAALGESVVAVGRHHDCMLKGSYGKVNRRGDHLQSDDLLSSSCTISEWGIGGPLVDVSSRAIIGMNFFGGKGFTPFMPGSVLLNCQQHFSRFGKVIRPWLGLKTRSVSEMKMDELKFLYHKFKCTDGLFVKKVENQSPADCAGILVGDVIVSFYGRPICSPPQFAEALLNFAYEYKDASKEVKRMANSLEVVILRPSTCERKILDIQPLESPPENEINRWPVLPPPAVVNWNKGGF